MKNTPSAPILFLVFNRPDRTEQVFATIKQARPAKLFIAADGPRPQVPTDAQKCQLVRSIATKVDWPCEVKTLFREKNLGCKVAVSEAIDWFFDHVEAGIILEDDCLPDASFFPFCTELLERYYDNDEVMMIGGSNSSGAWKCLNSYFFSKYGRLWGWATWRRAWAKYDVNIKSWADPKNKEIIKNRIGHTGYWKEKSWLYDRLYQGQKDTWDYQWEYAMFLHGGITVVPENNLIENIGFGADATHTFTKDKTLVIKSSHVNFPLSHPKNLDLETAYDKQFLPKYRLLRLAFKKIASLFKKK